MKFIHISDIHLADKLDFDSSYSKLIRKIKWDSFEKILNENKDVDFLLISGDLFERDYFSLKDYQKLFEIFEKFSKNIYYLCGNHDYIDSKNEIFFLDKPKNLHIFSSKKFDFFEYENVRIYGISYNDRIFDKNFNYNIRLDYNFYNIFLGHGEFNQNNSTYMNLDLEKIKNLKFDYVGLGHIHKREEFFKNIFYVGSIEPVSFKDKGDFGYNLVDDYGINFIDSSQMSFKSLKIDLNNFENFYGLEKYLANLLDKKYNFLSINLSNYDKFAFDEKSLKENLDITYLKINREKSIDYYENLGKIYESSLLGDFYKKVKDLDMEDPINKRCLEIGFDAILRSKDE